MAPDRGLSEIGDITRASVRRLKRVSRVGSDGISPLPITSVEGRRRAHWYLPGTTDGLRARKAKAAGHQINPVVAQSKIGRRPLDGFYACDFDLRQGRCRGFGCPQRPRLLRMCCKRPCRSHASKEADELACPHSITSSARRRHFDAEHLSSLEVDHQLIFCRCLYREVGWLLTLRMRST
jgi:hypothetical protein